MPIAASHMFVIFDTVILSIAARHLPLLSRTRHDLNSGDASGFNRRDRRSDARFQGRFKAVLVEDESPAMTALNPAGGLPTVRPAIGVAAPLRPVRAAKLRSFRPWPTAASSPHGAESIAQNALRGSASMAGMAKRNANEAYRSCVSPEAHGVRQVGERFVGRN